MKDSFGKRTNYPRKSEEQENPEQDSLRQAVDESKINEPIRNNFQKRDLNRAKVISREDDDQRSISIGLQEVDEAILYQFNENFNFHVKQNGRGVQVPTIYNRRERWEWARRNQRLRTVNDKVIYPLITFERTSASRDNDRENANSLNTRSFNVGTLESNVYLASTKYSKRNRYDKFSVLTDREPQREFHIIATPNYVTVDYDFQIFTEYMFQMNEIIEEISYLSNEYWGNPDGNLYKTNIDSINTEVETENDIRFIKGTFSATVRGYILPEEVADEATTKRAYTISKVVVGERIINNIDDIDKSY